MNQNNLYTFPTKLSLFEIEASVIKEFFLEETFKVVAKNKEEALEKIKSGDFLLSQKEHPSLWKTGEFINTQFIDFHIIDQEEVPSTNKLLEKYNINLIDRLSREDLSNYNENEQVIKIDFCNKLLIR